MNSKFILNLCTVYELNNWPHNPAHSFPLKYRLFRTVKLLRIGSKSNFFYNHQGITFDGGSLWSFGDSFAKNIEIFGVDDSTSSHTCNKKINFFVLDEGPIDGINDSTGAAGKKKNFIKAKTKFCLLLHEDHDKSYLYVNKI